MQRGSEILRQWNMLMAIAQSADCSYDALVAEFGVKRRTVQRDLETLSLVFPLEDSMVNGHKVWRLAPRALARIADAAFTLPELCAFYVHRGRLAQAGGDAIDGDLKSALDKVARALGPKMRRYLDQVTAVLSWKHDPAMAPDGNAKPGTVEALVRATIDRRRVKMDYHSLASGVVKAYVVEPYRLTFGNGGLYLFAFVPAYGEMRTFAVQRIKKLAVTDQGFNPVSDVPEDPYKHSIGIWAGGTCELLEIEFAPRLAPYIEERVWGEAQQITRRPDGSIVLSVKMAVDLPLRSWILGFGHKARVLRPTTLADAIAGELEEAREQYAPRTGFDLPTSIYDDSRQYLLPFRSSRNSRTRERRRPGSRPRA
jgi:predicted DNA-binding transcriptional regulator YafY